MAVPTVMSDLNVAAISNSPAATDQVFPLNDDYIRALASILRRKDAIGSNIASATATNIGGSTDGDIVNITLSTTPITSFTSVAAGITRVCVFAAGITITHNATSLIMPDGMNYITQAGDTMGFLSLGSGNWRCIFQSRKQTVIDMSGVSANIQLPVGYSASYSVSASGTKSLYLTVADGQAYRINFGGLALSAATITVGVRVNSSTRSTDYLTSVVANTGDSHLATTAVGDLSVGYSSVYCTFADIAVESASIFSSYRGVNVNDGTYRGIKSERSTQSVVATELTLLDLSTGTMTGSFIIQRIK